MLQNDVAYYPTILIYCISHKYDKFLPDALQSIINQTYPHNKIYLHFVANGCEQYNDNSEEIFREFKNSHFDEFRDIHVSYNDENRPFLEVANQILWNAAFKCSPGYVFRLDADDFLEANAVETMVNHMEPGNSVCYSNFFELDEFSVEIKHGYKAEEFHKLEHGACCLINFESFQSHGFYPDNLKSKDGKHLDLIFDNKTYLSNKFLWYYRKHEGSKTHEEKKI